MISKVCERLRELTSHYDIFVFPIYGTLHDGVRLDPAAFNCLIKLSEMGKGVAIFSNVPRRRATVIAELNQIGIPPSFYQHIVTAGEQTWLALKEKHDPFHGSLGSRCYYIGPASSFNILDNLPLYRVSSIEQADFILVMGFDEWHTDIENYYDILSQAVAAKMPMVCGSSDRFVRYDNHTVFKAGMIANYYQSIGGSVYFHGKPHSLFYKTLLNELSPVVTSRILMIGDSIATDIQGANANHLDSILIANETTLQELNLANDKLHTNEEILTNIIETGIIPRYFMRTLEW